MPAQIDTNGTPPLLAGRACEVFICEGLCLDGQIVETAHVTYLKFDGHWTRLYFEPGVIFWRDGQPTLTQFSDAEHTAIYPNNDVGLRAGVIGQTLLNYAIQPTEDGCQVIFSFTNGRAIELICNGEFTDYNFT
ncbi:MAG: hypothetical protein JNM09_20105 [Blastocatellia bacterium]|nr:hypothetical protein [Blastocatellia bacterium]